MRRRDRSGGAGGPRRGAADSFSAPPCAPRATANLVRQPTDVAASASRRKDTAPPPGNVISWRQRESEQLATAGAQARAASCDSLRGPSGQARGRAGRPRASGCLPGGRVRDASTRGSVLPPGPRGNGGACRIALPRVQPTGRRHISISIVNIAAGGRDRGGPTAATDRRDRGSRRPSWASGGPGAQPKERRGRCRLQGRR